MNTYSLESILASFSKSKSDKNPEDRIHKRMLYNLAAIGGISSSLVGLFFFSLPFIEFAAIFNPVVFNALGIAQSIVVFIVFLSIVMIIVFLVSWLNNKTLLKRIEPSWKSYFPEVDLKMVLSSGVTPYKEFFHAYSRIGTDVKGEVLHKALQEAFRKMEDENRDLVEAIQRDKNRA